MLVCSVREEVKSLPTTSDPESRKTKRINIVICLEGYLFEVLGFGKGVKNFFREPC